MRRCATLSFSSAFVPWVETHGYMHAVATRQSRAAAAARNTCRGAGLPATLPAARGRMAPPPVRFPPHFRGSVAIFRPVEDGFSRIRPRFRSVITVIDRNHGNSRRMGADLRRTGADFGRMCLHIGPKRWPPMVRRCSHWMEELTSDGSDMQSSGGKMDLRWFGYEVIGWKSRPPMVRRCGH